MDLYIEIGSTIIVLVLALLTRVIGSNIIRKELSSLGDVKAKISRFF